MRGLLALALPLALALAPAPALALGAAPAAPAAAAAAAAGEGPLHAGRVTRENAPRWLVGGPDAIGGVGDWALGNGTLCAVVSDPSHETILSPRGGVLVDLGHCGREDDQWIVLQPLMNASRGAVPVVSRVAARVSEKEARIETLSAGEGVELETTYRLDLSEPSVLRVHTRARRTGDGTWMRVLADVVLHGNRSLVPFTGSVRHPGDPDRASGFAHAPVDPEDPLQMASAIVPADLHVWVGADRIDPGVAYALQMVAARRLDADGRSLELPIVSINGESFSLLGVLTRPFWWGGEGGVGLLQLAQAVLFDLSAGETIEIERALRVGRRADVASVTDPIFEEAAGSGALAVGRVVGRVDDPDARLHVTTEDGGAITFVRPEPDGRFAYRAPAGSHRIRWRAPGHRRGRVPVRVPASGEVDLGLVETGAAGRLALPQGAPMRLVFLGEKGTKTPRFRSDLLGFRLGDRRIGDHARSNDVVLAGVAGDPTHVTLPPGHYRVLATRGPEFGLTEAAVAVRAGRTTELAVEAPTRVLETPGWLSADLHLHALPSDDSTFDLASRIRSLVASGLDVGVATDHDAVSDYGPVIARMGLRGVLASVVGSEVTTTAWVPEVPFTAGHSNAFPLTVRPLAYRSGALEGEGRRLRRIRAGLDARGGERILQLNHPRRRGAESNRGNYFDHLSVVGRPFDPAKPIDEGDNAVLVERDPETGLRDVDFDAVELLNGPGMLRYRLTRADWLSLLLQGFVATATANSDTHRAEEVAATPRNYLPVADDDPASFRDPVLIDAVQRGALYGTTGPLLDVHLEGAGLGDLFEGRAGTLRVGVRAAPWVPVSELRVYVDGREVHRGSVAAGDEVAVPLRFEGDGFVTVEVEGAADPTFSALLPGFVPFAFTNPIFVDADGDGRWTAPGLPATLPPAITDPLAGCGPPCNPAPD